MISGLTISIIDIEIAVIGMWNIILAILPLNSDRQPSSFDIKYIAYIKFLY